MDKHYFFTGFPGFISNQLIREVLRQNDFTGKVVTLVLPSMVEKARSEKAAIVSELNLEENQFELIEGDITKENLNLSDQQLELLRKEITHVFHLAAIYDLAVPKEIAYKVNVEGTRNVNNWVCSLNNLKRYTYFSTAYVAGRREGILYEHELIEPPSFKNYYEETKYKAELLVDSIKNKVPVTIIRPGVVKGHSKTGETIKFDGPYFMLNILDRLRGLPVLPYLGKTEADVNLVPIDYIIRATTYLTFLDKGEGKTYHLTDPRPYKVTEVYEMIMKEQLNRQPKGTIPLGLASIFLQIKAIRKFLGVEKEALEYFTWKGVFDCSVAQEDLKDSGIVCPDLKDGIPSMIGFYHKHKHNPQYQINIL